MRGTELLPYAEAVEGNDQLLTEILVRLPLKVLVRFKCISKRWLWLISTPFLLGRHTVHHATTTRVSGILLLSPEFLEADFKLFYLNKINRSASPFCPKIPGIKLIWQSCNGLLLFATPTSEFIYNPTTKDIKLLPEPIPASSPSSFDVTLAFDPLRSPIYTLIGVWTTRESPGCYQTMIYSSQAERQAWRPCGSSFVAPSDMDFSRGVYFSGAMHWICAKNRVSLCFDIREQCMRNNMPPLPERDQCYVAAPACGYLNLVGYDCKFHIRVFRLENDYSRWVSMHTVDLRSTYLPTDFPTMVDRRSMLGTCYTYGILHLLQDGRRGSEDDMSLLLQIPGKVIAFRLKDNTYFKVFDFGSPSRQDLPVTGWYTAYEYIESLVCV